MIYLKNTTDTQVVRIPASGPKVDGVVTLEMVNTIDRGPAFVFEFDQAVYLVDADGAYVHGEGTTAPTEEALTFGLVTLTPETIMMRNVMRIECKDGCVILTDLMERQMAIEGTLEMANLVDGVAVVKEAATA